MTCLEPWSLLLASPQFIPVSDAVVSGLLAQLNPELTLGCFDCQGLRHVTNGSLTCGRETAAGTGTSWRWWQCHLYIGNQSVLGTTRDKRSSLVCREPLKGYECVFLFMYIFISLCVSKMCDFSLLPLCLIIKPLKSKLWWVFLYFRLAVIQQIPVTSW